MTTATTDLLARCAPAAPAAAKKKVGHITPSSNTTVEPLTTLLGLLAGGLISQHFSRISVRRLALDDAAQHQFDVDSMLSAARLLAEAPLDAIAWNGTSGGWLGVAQDEAIVQAIEAATNIRATTTTLAMLDTYRRHGWKRIGIACPYTDDVLAAMVREYEHHGLRVVSTANLGLEANVDMGNASLGSIGAQLRAVAAEAPDCIAVICTNLSAIQLTADFEAAFGIPIVDSVAATFVGLAHLCDIDVRIDGMGRLLSGV
jgi:maleate isomerase